MEPEEIDGSFEGLLEHIRRHRGVDFAAYKPSTLRRRIAKRMQDLEVESYQSYLDYLQASPDEFGPLLDAVFINVTRFFRDGDAWDTLRTEVIPKIVDGASPSEPIRIWCAGVASGEEAYSVAMLLAEEMGDRDFTSSAKIFATDIDDEVLLRARSATYRIEDLEAVPEQLREKYFESASGGFQFRSDFRRAVIFGRHDLLEDAPISRLRLLICRNTLMYFNREAQNRVLARFHFALRPEGYLFLGNAEMLLTRRNLFLPVDGKARLFRKVTDLTFQDRVAVMSQVGGDEEQQAVAGEARIRDVAFDSSPTAEIVIDAQGNVALVNAAARALFKLGRGEVGRPFQDMDVSYRPAELRGPIEAARHERKSTELRGVSWRIPAGNSYILDVKVNPLLEDGSLVAVKVAFHDVTRFQEMASELSRSKRDTEVAYEELQSAKEELEATNEELQSTVEELETTNEDLQSTNEELETMNEALQSTNVEFETVNEELRQRTDELVEVNHYTRSVLDGIGMVVVVLDTDFAVRTWNREAQELWGLRTEDVLGHPFLALDIGLPVYELGHILRQCMSGEIERGERSVPGHDRKGKPVTHEVTCIPLRARGESPTGVVLVANGKETAKETVKV